MTSAHPLDVFEDAIGRLDRAFQFAEIDDEAVQKLKHPKQALEVSIPVRMDDGSLRIFTGYRVRHFRNMPRRPIPHESGYQNPYRH